ncbi:interleukin-6-like isoform X1 [Oncorhynchus tshawytscha]|uniref:Interleukin-6 n=2 Tax=Oncorhynchus tshawytscha TaxID=74940 RepID=A0AAZ3P4M3_ONCTS|nr:interleukin-6-like isoform X1 [Oncorhynchus tshawytscha]
MTSTHCKSDVTLFYRSTWSNKLGCVLYFITNSSLALLLHSDLSLLSVLVVMVVNGSPVPSAPVWTSGEELAVESFSGEPGAPPIWENVIKVIKLLVQEVINFRDQQFVEEFQKPVEEMSSFIQYQVPSIPTHLSKTPCSTSNYNKEACLQKISHGLQVYHVLLQHVKAEYPQSTLLPSVMHQTTVLIGLFKDKMKAAEVVEDLSASERERVLGEVSTGIEWERKTSVHAILRELRHFLVDTKTALRTWRRGAKAASNHDITMVGRGVLDQAWSKNLH